MIHGGAPSLGRAFPPRPLFFHLDGLGLRKDWGGAGSSLPLHRCVSITQNCHYGPPWRRVGHPGASLWISLLSPTP